MNKAANVVLKKCLNLKKNESILIVTDSKLYNLAVEFFYQAAKITKKLKLATIPIPKVNGTEPPKGIAKETLEKTAFNLSDVKKWIGDKKPEKVIVVPDKLVSIVIK